MQIRPTDPDAPRLDRRRGTSIAVWLVILALVTTLLVLRLPLLERLARARTADLLGDLGDPDLGDASVRVGAITAIAVFIVVTIVVAVVASLLERWLGPTAWTPRSWLRVGAGGMAMGVVAIGLQVAAVVAALPSVGRSPGVLVAVVAVAALVPLAFREARTARGYRRTAVVTVVAGVLAWMQ